MISRLAAPGLACLALTAGLAAQQPTAGTVRAFVNARLIDGTGQPVVADAVLLVRDGRVQAAGPARTVRVPVGVERIDVDGRVVAPGLVNAHGHVGQSRGLASGAEHNTTENVAAQLGLYARYGVTTVFSLGGDGEAGIRLRDAQNTPTLDRARLFVAGPVVDATTPEEARSQVAAASALGVNVIKIRVDDNLGASTKMPEPVYRAVIDEAHRRGLRVAAHLYYLADAKALLRAGVDLLAHSIRDTEVDNELIDLLKARDVCACPTLTREVSTFIYESTPAFFTDPFFLREADEEVVRLLNDPARQEAARTSRSAQQYKASLPVAMRNLKRLADAGVRIAFGTDTGPPARFQGYFEHMELEMMVKAGLTPAQVLQAATADAARCMNVSEDLGTLTPGRWADFVVLEANPLDDITNARQINSVWVAGNRVERAPNNPSQNP